MTHPIFLGRFENTLAQQKLQQPDWDEAKAYVLDRLSNELSPDLYYHGIHHTRDDVLPAAERLAALAQLDEANTFLLRTAALYHDIGYIVQYEANEALAAGIAERTLPQFGYRLDQIQAIKGIIMATKLPQCPKNLLEMLMCDSDLDTLGRDDFFTTSLNLRKELEARGEKITTRAWYKRQLKFLAKHTYFTTVAQALRETGKQKNIGKLRHLIESLS